MIINGGAMQSWRYTLTRNDFCPRLTSRAARLTGAANLLARRATPTGEKSERWAGFIAKSGCVRRARGDRRLVLVWRLAARRRPAPAAAQTKVTGKHRRLGNPLRDAAGRAVASNARSCRPSSTPTGPTSLWSSSPSRPPDRKSRLLRIVAPLGVLLPPGVGLRIDNEDYGRMNFIRCQTNGCVAEVFIDDKLLPKLGGGPTPGWSSTRRSKRASACR